MGACCTVVVDQTEAVGVRALAVNGDGAMRGSTLRAEIEVSTPGAVKKCGKEPSGRAEGCFSCVLHVHLRALRMQYTRFGETSSS